jgi:hypothetical protein
MAFTLTGTIRGRPATATWKNGAISSDQATLAELQQLIDTETIVLTAIPAHFAANQQPAWVAIATLEHLFDPGTKLTGHRPKPPWFNNPPGTVY